MADNQIKAEVLEIVDRETKAWDTKDVELLLSIFHPDMVWVWPKTNKDINPINWELPLGKFDQKTWRDFYTKMFEEYTLIKNERNIVDIKIGKEGDDAFAVVDIDTLWESENGNQMHWVGRTGKTYVKVNGEWKMIAQFGPILF